MEDSSSFTSLPEVRAEIDRVDQEIVKLIGRRMVCVKHAARFKTSERDVAASERVTSMLETRRGWAVTVGVNPDMIEKLFLDMVMHFITTETEDGGRASPKHENWATRRLFFIEMTWAQGRSFGVRTVSESLRQSETRLRPRETKYRIDQIWFGRDVAAHSR